MKDTVTYPLSAIMDEDEESPAEQLEREIAKAIAAERERCVKECIAMADDFEFEVNQRGLVEKMKQRFGVK